MSKFQNEKVSDYEFLSEQVSKENKVPEKMDLYEILVDTVQDPCVCVTGALFGLTSIIVSIRCLLDLKKM